MVSVLLSVAFDFITKCGIVTVSKMALLGQSCIFMYPIVAIAMRLMNTINQCIQYLILQRFLHKVSCSLKSSHHRKRSSRTVEHWSNENYRLIKRNIPLQSSKYIFCSQFTIVIPNNNRKVWHQIYCCAWYLSYIWWEMVPESCGRKLPY